MKFFVRFALFFVVATVSIGCIASAVDSPPVDHASAPASIVTGASVIPATSGSVAAIPSNSFDGDRQEIGNLRASQKALPAPSSPNRPTPVAPVSAIALDPPAPSSTDFVAPPLPKSSNSVARISKPSRPLEGAELDVHVPPQANAGQPLRVLVVLHGMGGSGEVFSQSLVGEAERNGWVLVAPTFQYHDYLDPKQLMEDDILFAQRIQDTLAVLPQRLNLKLRQHVLLYGFSRGAQLAHRFAYFYPDRVESVVTLSAGAYTLPTEKWPMDKGTQVIPFPFGIGDLRECVGEAVNWQALKKISFWIAVGARDNQAGDVSRAFDQYGGKTRVERAQTFQQALKALGIDVHLAIFPGATHEMTTEMRVGAMQFLRDDELADHWDD